MQYTAEELSKLPNEELIKIKEKILTENKQLESQQKVGGFLGGMGNAFLGGMRGDWNSKTDTDMAEKINTLRATEAVKADIESKDPYRQSQVALNQAMLKNIQGGGAGGDLIYRDPATGVEIPQEQALADIGQGKQYIVKRRVATRQGVKEEPVSEPKPQIEGEVKTSTGAEEVLSEIAELENIIKSEPKDSGASIPFFGKSAQAQGVKIPFVAPYGVSEKGQAYRTLRESINNRLLYLRSGAQINDKEYQRLSGMLPELFRADKVDLQQLERFKNEFTGILSRLQTGRRATITPPSTPTYSVGQTISKGGKNWIVTGIDTDGTPLVDPA